MIEIRELTIKSHVLYNGDWERIEHLDSRCIGFDDSVKFKFVTPDEVEPIHLTEDVLKKLGFDYLKVGWVLDNNDYEITIDKSEINDWWWVNVMDYKETWRDNAIYIRYLHELENFVFLITKKRLKV